jgi:probable HAF family extracellular repeat protein
MVDLGGLSRIAAAVSPNGQIVGSAWVAGKPFFRAVLWDKEGVMTDLGDLGLVPQPPSMGPGRPFGAVATGINPAGRVVGNIRYQRTHRAFLWDNGAMTDLGNLGDAFWQFSYAYGINPAGQIVGQSYTAALFGRAFLWESGVMTNLGTLTPSLSDGESAALAISPSGVVVGYSSTFVVGVLQFHAVLWQNGVITDLGIPGGENYATSINAAGQVVGYGGATCCGSGPFFALIWQDGATTDLGTLGGTQTYAYGINARGQVVGASQAADGTYHAFVWEEGIMTDLGAGSAQAISANGTIVGVNNSGIAVMWRR